MADVSIILTDDWELRGNGTGTVEEYQRKPALRLMALYEQLGIRSTFNLEVMQQLAFERHASRFSEIRAGRDAWLRTVREMCDRGFDTQLHIHPQWWNAEYIDGWWKLGRRWHIADYSPDEIAKICDLAFAYMESLIAPRRVRTFRAGSWGMGPPSRAILRELIARGIRIDVSIAAGLRYRGEGIELDYSCVESPYRAYTPDLDDIRRVRRAAALPDIIEIPTQSVTHWQLARKYLQAAMRGGTAAALAPLRDFLWEWLQNEASYFLRKLMPRRSRVSFEQQNVPAFVMRDPFGVATGAARFGLVVDISNGHHPEVLKHMVDLTIERARASAAGQPQALVYENHTKDLRSDADFARIHALIEHIQRHHPDVKFRTLAEVVDSVAPEYPRATEVTA